MSRIIGATRSPSSPAVNEPGTGAATQPAASTVPADAGKPAGSSHGIFGKLKKFGAQAGKSTSKALGKSNDLLGLGGYTILGSIADGGALKRTFDEPTHATTEIGTRMNEAGMAPLTLDMIATGVGVVQKGLDVHQRSREVKATAQADGGHGAGSLDNEEARRGLSQAKSTLIRNAPIAIRDVPLSSVSEAGRIVSIRDPHASLYGAAHGQLNGDGGMAIGNGALAVAAGVLTKQHVDRGVERNLALTASLRHPASQRGEVDSTGAAALDALDDAADSGALKPNVYAAVRGRSVGDIAAFMQKFDALPDERKTQLNKMLHFPGAKNLLNVFNYRRTTSLNTASMRAAARDNIVDRFIAEPDGGDLDALFDALRQVKAESRGSRIAGAQADLASFVPDDPAAAAGFEALNHNVRAAVSRLSAADQRTFATKYAQLGDAERTRFHDAMHFTSLRPWRDNSTLATTKYPRADVRQALVEHFVEHGDVQRLGELKARYATKTVPLKTGGTPAQAPAAQAILKHHIEAAQHANLAALGEENRHAKILMTYGGANVAAGVAELAVNPLGLASAGELSAARAVTGPIYFGYVWHRVIVGALTQRNAQPIGPALREESLRHALPQLKEALTPTGAPTQHFADADVRSAFLKQQLKLNDADIVQLGTLESQGDHAGARAFLVGRNPENLALLALHKVAHAFVADTAAGKTTANSSAIGLVIGEMTTTDHPPLATLDIASTPEAAFAALKDHFLGDAADPSKYVGIANDPRAGLRFAARQPSSERSAEQLATQFSTENPLYAVRLFAADLRSGGDAGTEAKNMLRDLRFTEHEIDDLGKMSPQAATAFLEDHLFSENARRRFSAITLDKSGKRAAAAVVDSTPIPSGSDAEPLSWRSSLEARGVKVIDNQGSPGLDSMLTSLYQSLNGNSQAGPHAMHRAIADARRAIRTSLVQQSPAGTPARGLSSLDMQDPAQLWSVLWIASRTFGRPDAAIKVAYTGEAAARQFGATQPAGDAPDAVVCYDTKSKRSFVLNGGGQPAPAEDHTTAPAISPSPAKLRRTPLPLRTEGPQRGFKPSLAAIAEKTPPRAPDEWTPARQSSWSTVSTWSTESSSTSSSPLLNWSSDSESERDIDLEKKKEE